MATIRRLLYVLALTYSCSVFAAETLDVNAASAEQFAQVMSGIGPSRAEAIVRYRSQYGPFTDVDDMLRVPGVGSATIDKNRALLSVGAPVN